jgi:hypothetical protein
MLKRNDPTWLSAVKLSILPLATAALLVANTAQAQWVLIDNFEGLAAGDLIEGTTGPGATWTGNMVATNSAQEDPDCVANTAMQIPGEPNASALRAAFTDATTNIAAGATGTLFYRFRTPDSTLGTSDHVIGLTDNPDLTNFNFKSGLRNIVPAGNQLDLRDSGSYEEAAQLADNTWYSLWMVTTNTNPGTFEVYLQSDTDTNFATQTQLLGDDAWDYRINGATDIINVYFRNANNPGGVMGNTIYIDDIHINPAASDLSTPAGVGVCPTGVIKGDVNMDGEVTFLDIAPFIAALSLGEYQAEADCNCDSELTFIDIQPFIDILSGN